MATTTSGSRPSIARLIFIPALISLAVTVLRTVGEIQHWSETWFSRSTGGIMPSGVSWLFGISWLALPFGVYFALKLAAAGQGPPHVGKAIGYALLGLAVILIGRSVYFYLFRHSLIKFPQILIIFWLFMVVAALIQRPGWPALFKTLLAYGLAARIPVVVVMFLAMCGQWGTHYDYFGLPPEFQMDFWPKYLWLGFVPQLTFWVGFTIVMGSLSGIIATAAERLQLKKEKLS